MPIKSISEALEDLKNESIEGEDIEPNEKAINTRQDLDHDEQILLLAKKITTYTDLQEAIIDIGEILGLWNSDVIGISLKNVVEFNKVRGEPKTIIKQRKAELKKKLKAYAEKSG